MSTRRRPSTTGLASAARALVDEARRTPALERWEGLVEDPAAGGGGSGLRATFMGVSTVLLHDGASSVLTDGFFSRPNIMRTFLGRVSPDRRRIDAALRRARIDRLDAVFVSHSHYDHALDSATVARKTGAWLLGSQSTRQIARGEGFPAERFLGVTADDPLRFGAFTLTAVESVHSPGDRAPGAVEAPLVPPASSTAYRTGDCYSLFVEHRGRSLLVHASAGFVPGALDGRHADTVYLGIATLGEQSAEYREEYWRQTVRAVGARRVVPVHWDNFTRSLQRPLKPMPRRFDDVPATLTWLEERARKSSVILAMPRLAEPVDPWAGLD